MLRRRGARIEERLIGDALSEHMDRVDTGRDLWPTISGLLSRRKRTQFPKIAAVAATTVVVSLFAFLAVVRPWSNSDYQFDYQYTGYLTEEIPPCQPAAGSSTDPCASQEGQQLGGSSEASLYFGDDEPFGVAAFVSGFSLTSSTHLIVRGTYLPNSVRCSLQEIRDRDPTSLGTSTFCFADIRANEYILGSGPPTLTVLVLEHGYNQHLFTEEEREDVRLFLERVLVEGGWIRNVGGFPDGGIAGLEEIMFIGPSLELEMEAWEVHFSWNVEQKDDGTVIAAHPHRSVWERRAENDETIRAALEMDLPTFRKEVSAAHRARLTAYGGRTGPSTELPMIQTDANRITELYTSLGQYSHPDGPPESPPPACGLAVPTPYNPGLLLDCQLLLVLKDGLRGTATLNWDSSTAISSWDGLTTGGTPTRVTKVELDDESLTGKLSAKLGRLVGLTHLDLSGNSLTGDIPRSLGQLDNLVEVRLSGNSLTGCIPYGLKDVATSDLSSLSNLYCPPAPGATAGTATATRQPLTWPAVTGTSNYRVEYQKDHHGGRQRPWLLDSQSITTASRTVEGLTCETKYWYIVSAQGDGTTYSGWSEPSEVLKATTGSCTPPVFESGSYSFTVADDAPIGTIVGTVQATDNSGQPVVYSITGYLVIPAADPSAGFFGADHSFAIDPNTGVITVPEDMSRTVYRTANLEVTATDAAGGVAIVEVLIEITKS